MASSRHMLVYDNSGNKSWNRQLLLLNYVSNKLQMYKTAIGVILTGASEAC